MKAIIPARYGQLENIVYKFKQVSYAMSLKVGLLSLLFYQKIVVFAFLNYDSQDDWLKVFIAYSNVKFAQLFETII
jgi:hypothetical protein